MHCGNCGHERSGGSNFCTRCGTAFGEDEPGRDGSFAPDAGLLAPAASGGEAASGMGPPSPAPPAVNQPAGPATIAVAVDGSAGLLTATPTHLVLQTESSVQRWTHPAVRAISHNGSTVRIDAGGANIELAVTGGDPAALFGSSGPLLPRPTTSAPETRAQPDAVLLWVVAGALAAATLGALVQLADDHPFGFAVGLWLTAAVPVALAAAAVVLHRTPPSPNVAAFDPLRPLLAPGARFVPIASVVGALLLLSSNSGDALQELLTWVPLAVLTGINAWMASETVR